MTGIGQDPINDQTNKNNQQSNDPIASDDLNIELDFTSTIIENKVTDDLNFDNIELTEKTPQRDERISDLGDILTEESLKTIDDVPNLDIDFSINLDSEPSANATIDQTSELTEISGSINEIVETTNKTGFGNMMTPEQALDKSTSSETENDIIASFDISGLNKELKESALNLISQEANISTESPNLQAVSQEIEDPESIVKSDNIGENTDLQPISQEANISTENTDLQPISQEINISTENTDLQPISQEANISTESPNLQAVSQEIEDPELIVKHDDISETLNNPNINSSLKKQEDMSFDLTGIDDAGLSEPKPINNPIGEPYSKNTNKLEGDTISDLNGELDTSKLNDNVINLDSLDEQVENIQKKAVEEQLTTVSTQNIIDMVEPTTTKKKSGKGIIFKIFVFLVVLGAIGVGYVMNPMLVENITQNEIVKKILVTAGIQTQQPQNNIIQQPENTNPQHSSANNTSITNEGATETDNIDENNDIIPLTNDQAIESLKGIIENAKDTIKKLETKDKENRSKTAKIIRNTQDFINKLENGEDIDINKLNKRIDNSNKFLGSF